MGPSSLARARPAPLRPPLPAAGSRRTRSARGLPRSNETRKREGDAIRDRAALTRARRGESAQRTTLLLLSPSMVETTLTADVMHSFIPPPANAGVPGYPTVERGSGSLGAIQWWEQPPPSGAARVDAGRIHQGFHIIVGHVSHPPRLSGRPGRPRSEDTTHLSKRRQRGATFVRVAPLRRPLASAQRSR